jgi:hypothetical protein
MLIAGLFIMAIGIDGLIFTSHRAVPVAFVFIGTINLFNAWRYWCRDKAE